MSDQPPRRRRRRWLQISLRSYLILSILAAVGLWCSMYWLREYWPQLAGTWGPPPSEVAYPGGWQALEHHRTVKDKETGETSTVRQGRFALVDKQGYSRCIGWYENDKPSGTWTWYHENGRRALQGECRDGYRTGTWTAWYPNGYTQWEIEHGAPLDLHDVDSLFDDDRQKQQSPNVSPATFVVSPGPLGMGGMGAPQPLIVAIRNGDARTWWDNGQLESRGAYRFDRREGSWTFFSRDGRRTAEGRYERGHRRGRWTEWDDAGRERVVYYAEGLRIENLADLEQRLEAALEAEDRATALELIAAFGSIGGDAAAQLAPAIASDDEELVRAALGEATAMRERAAPLKESVEQAQRRWSGTTALMARLAHMSIDKQGRAAAMRTLLQKQQEGAWEDELLFYQRLADAGPVCVPLLESLLSDKDVEVRRRAVHALARLMESVRWQATERDAPDFELLEKCVAALRRAAKSKDAGVSARATAALDAAAQSPLVAPFLGSGFNGAGFF